MSLGKGTAEMEINDDDVRRELRKAYGLPDPKRQAPQVTEGVNEEASKKALAIWDFIMAQKGTVENILPDD
jgi:hypothetical protein